MTYLAAWLLALGAADLVRPSGALPRGRGRVVAPFVLAGVLLVAWLLTGASVGAGLFVWAGLLLVGIGWIVLSARAIATGMTTPLAGVRPRRPSGRGLRLGAVACIVAGTLLALAANGSAPAPVGAVAQWYSGLGLRSLHGVDLPRALLVVGAFAVQVGTANALVRIGLDAAGARSEPGVLRGGRLVGPLERVFILGLGLAGQMTAASIVIAAKGLLRFPELNKQGAVGQRIDAVTEYFVVGSFVSWLVALLALCLARA